MGLLARSSLSHVACEITGAWSFDASIDAVQLLRFSFEALPRCAPDFGTLGRTMTGEKKKSPGKSALELPSQQELLSRKLTHTDSVSHGSVKGSKKLLPKTYKPAPATISSPPKAALASSNAKKDEGHRRRNPLNDILRRRSGDGVAGRKDESPPLQDIEPRGTSQSSDDVSKIDDKVVARITELEGALKIAREEQDALRQELEQFKQLRPDNRDPDHDQTPDDILRASGVPANEDLMDTEHTDSPPRADTSVTTIKMPSDGSTIDYSNDEIIRQNYELRFRIAQLQDQLTSQNITHCNNIDQALSHGDAEWSELRLRLHATEKESQERLQQLLALKSSISSLTRTDSQVTDSELIDSFSQLSNRIREWIISHFRRTKIDLANHSPEIVKLLNSITPAYDSIEKSDKLSLYQALVSRTLMQIFEEPIVVGLPQSGLLAAIRTFALNVQNNGSEYCEWRRATIRAIEKGETGKVVEEGRSDLLYCLAGEIAHVLFAVTSVTLTPAAQSALMGILNVAADLQRTLALQRAKYQLLFFRRQDNDTGAGFDERKMDSVNDPDDIDETDNILSHRIFLFCVFPSLQKFGNEWGENEEVVNMLLKAKVCCGVG